MMENPVEFSVTYEREYDDYEETSDENTITYTFSITDGSTLEIDALVKKPARKSSGSKYVMDYGSKADKIPWKAVFR